MYKRTLMLVEIAIFASLAFLLDTIPGLQFKLWAQGGSISLAMIPVLIVAIRWGVKAGLVSGLILGTLDLIFGGYVVHWFQAFLDYFAAFAILGLAGIFHKQLWSAINSDHFKRATTLMVGGVFIAILGRFIAHYIAGLIFWGHLAPEGQPVWLYSLIYNGSYLLPGFILSAVLLALIINTRPKIIFREA
ncbi:energy-coupled thiamine transporter ThiT [Halalkalibacillus sediminis]|uniref:Energy-coupled thiamine transporter ThiT n=1 Tax=Halalkalibacillus sediminis TaxID=2018042 RepID=A0A2I0QVS0_9BACI|nr:energy-coupled thiamine transporter ThiT [Halalkalibacillus sediminis]PKR78437.1 energy-coupled thiamine transporter ThiT [Halalkalibacillus sediminis]